MAAVRTFRTLWKWLVPSWLNTGEGELVGYVLMLFNDATLERLYLGHLARFPQQGPDGSPAPTDALDALGRDRGMVRGIGETDTSYAARLTQWLVDARTRGTAFTLMKQLAAYCDYDGSKGCSFRVVDNRGNWFSRSSAGVETSSLNTGNWDWDGDTAKWSRFWVVIYPGTRWGVEGTFGDGALYGDTTGTLGNTATPEQVATVRSIIAEWKPDGTRGQVILATSGSTFDPTAPEPDGLWSEWSKYSGGTAVASRLASGRYFGV